MTVEERIRFHTQGAARALAVELHRRRMERVLANFPTRAVPNPTPTAGRGA